MKKILFASLLSCFLFSACNAMEEENIETVENAYTAETTSVEVATTEVPEEEETETIPEEIEGPITVLPLPGTLDIMNLNDCTIAVSLEEGDVYVNESGVMEMKVTVYTYDVYDMVDISLLKIGDSITIRQENVKITSLERGKNGEIYINGGLDNGGYELRNDDNGVFFEIGYSDVKFYYSIGEATLDVSRDLQYTDASDLDKGEVIYYFGDFLREDSEIDYYFVPNNTCISIKDGSVISMYRIYNP